MSEHSPIQWTDATLNAIVGCDYVSTGCLHCYAATLHNRRYLAWKRGRFPDAPVQYHQPFKRVQLLPERLLHPFRWRKPRKVFFNSVSDLWHDDVPDWFIARAWAMMALTPQHTWQILTKRPERMRDWLQGDRYHEVLHQAHLLRELLPAKRLGDIAISDPRHFPLQNVWLGVSVEDQAAADERIPLLLQTPAAVRFLSCEPLLGPLYRLNRIQRPGYLYTADIRPADSALKRGISWCIVGGESGSRARPMDLVWARTLVKQCRAAGTAVFVKQLGSVNAKTLGLRDRHGGTMDEWPDELAALRVREFPQAAVAQMEVS